MGQKQINQLATEWLEGDKDKRTSIQHKLRGSTGLNALLDAIAAKLPTKA
ncbi:hypothetical protein P5704_026450 (plasmid) [Pseudomonas sp. FeN3W]|nr:hypothetical protein P5704_026450 [Pseudomonas sp. FeN3W]